MTKLFTSVLFHLRGMIRLFTSAPLNRRGYKKAKLTGYLISYSHSLKGRSRGYISSFQNIAKKLEKFQTDNNYQLMTDSLDEKISEELVYFLKKEGLKPATIKSIVARLLRVLESAKKKGYIIDDSIKDIPIISEEPFSIYLTEAELKNILELKLRKEADLIRNVFLIGCYTGLRYSDLVRLNKDNFFGGIIRSASLKTKVVSEIPIHPLILPILEKYNYSIPQPKTLQNYNKILKNICKRAGITEPVLLEYTKGLKRIKKKVPKYTLVSSHTARRSLATNMYLAGEPVYRVMMITGHKTEESFLRYIRISKSENAKELKKKGFFAEK